MSPNVSFQHAYLKLLTDSLSTPTTTQNPSQQQQQQQPPPPPAYTPSASQPNTNTTLPATLNFDPSALYDSESEPDTPPAPLNINIDASTKIVGHGNYICSSASIDSARLVAGMLAALGQGGVEEKERPVEINVNCGVSVAGCRNVVGGKGIGVAGAGTTATGEQGVKRKAEEELAEEPKSKKVVTEG